jgi:hypothetical protein
MSVFLLSSCISSESDEAAWRRMKEIPAKKYVRYSFDRRLALRERITVPPDFLLDYLEEMDGIGTYSSYDLADEEKTLVVRYLDLLPEKNIEILVDYCIGFYFVRNFLGSAMADYVIAEDDSLFYIMIINPDTMKHDMSEWMTMRELSCLKSSLGSLSLRVDCGTMYAGLLYALLHESFHIVDYVDRITPYVERHLKYLVKDKVTDHPFTSLVWSSYDKPLSEYDFPQRERVAFYGLGGGPKLEPDDAYAVYDALSRSPFASLYGSMSWAEDFAEYATWHYYTRVLEQPYRLVVQYGVEQAREYSFMDSQLVDGRASNLEIR